MIYKTVTDGVILEKIPFVYFLFSSFNSTFERIYRVFHNVLRDYKNLLQEIPRTRIYETCTDRRNNSKIAFPVSSFSSQFTFLTLGDVSVCSEKMAGRSRFVCWSITRISLWLLYKVHFVKSTKRTRLQTRPFVLDIKNLLKLGVFACRMHPC